MLSSSWAFFDKVPLNEILKAAVCNQSSTFAKFYLRDMSQQATNLQNFGLIVVAQKLVGRRGGGWGVGEGGRKTVFDA